MMTTYPSDWPELSAERKREWRFDGWRDSAARIPFVSPEARAAHRARMERLISVYKVEEPDRVPVHIEAGLLPLASSGLDYHTCLHQPEKAVEAWRAFSDKYAEELDCYPNIHFFSGPGAAFDLLDHRLWSYPGHGMEKDRTGLQFVEGEYMLADEYDALITDPSDFWLRTFLPRAYGAFEPLASLSPLTDITMMPEMQLLPLARPDVRATLQTLLDAGREMSRYYQIIGQVMGEAEANGYFAEPPGAFATAPFDTLGDSLRGTRGILTDMHRQPGKLLDALEVVADVTIRSLVASPRVQDAVVVFFPLHKGADGWMSREQFSTFYWPTLKRVVSALADEGLVSCLFAEGCYDSRLEMVDEFPRGAVHWWFDRVDMAKAKKILGGNCSLQGNVPASLLAVGTAAEVTEACQRLIDVCAPGGGYMLGAGAFPDFPRIENLRAMVQAGQGSRYGPRPPDRFAKATVERSAEQRERELCK